MIETEIKTKHKELRLAPFLNRALQLIYNGQQDPDVEPKVYRITMRDAIRCSELTQWYQEVALTKAHGLRIRSTSKCILADQELKASLALTTELSEFDLRTGDPGIALLKHFMWQDDLVSYGVDPDTIGFESIEEAIDIFTTITEYSFLTKRRKKLESQFKRAEERMRSLVEYYQLQGRFTWNQRTGNGGKVRTRPSTDFLNDYPAGAIE